jgi:hypothetical protein
LLPCLCGLDDYAVPQSGLLPSPAKSEGSQGWAYLVAGPEPRHQTGGNRE